MEQKDRLKKARLEAGYKKPRDAYSALGIASATFYGHENGSRALTAKAGRLYADKYRVRFEWLMNERGPMKVGKSDPLQELYDAIPPEKREIALDIWKSLANPKK